MQVDGRQIAVQVRAVREVAEDVRLIALAPVDGPTGTYAAGSHLDIGLDVEGRTLWRSYSLVGEGPADGAWQIAVKRVEPSRGGSAAAWRLAPGALLPAHAPKSHFDLSPGRPDYLLVAGGIGITPLVGMAARLRRLGAPVRLVYAARRRSQLAFLDALRDLLGDRLTVHLDDEAGPLDLAAALAGLHADGEAYVCGPSGMMAAMRALWQAAGRPAERLRFETFGSGGAAPTEPFRVHVRDHDAEIMVPADMSLLDALAGAGIELAADCLRGECGLCTVQVVACDGTLDHRDVFLSDGQRQAQQRLCACVSRARGAITIDTGYRADL